MKRIFLFLLFATTALAAVPSPGPLIEISARFTETDPKTGKVDVLSAPRISTRPENRARIEVTRQVSMMLAETKGSQTDFTVGISLDVTGWIVGDDLLLKGVAQVRELDNMGEATPTENWAHVVVDEIPFVLRMKDGEPRDLPIEKSARSGSNLRIQITAKKHVQVNASPLYWQAFAVMPKLDEAEKKLLDSKAAGEAERALVAKADAALKLMHEATLADYCDWNLDLSKGPSLQLPHLATARELAKLALLKARVGTVSDALMRQEDVMRMARHIAAAPLLICRLVDLSLEAQAIDEMAAMLPQWSDDARGRQAVVVENWVTNTDEVATIGECVAAEGKSMSAWLTKELEAELKKGGAFDVRAWLGRLLAPTGSGAEEALKQLDATGMFPKDAAAVRELIEGYRVQMAELARVIRLPREQMKNEAAALEQKFKAGPRNLFVALLAPAVLKARQSELKGEVRMAMLKAAIEVQVKGDAGLPGELATWAKTERGFTLTSKEQFEGKPVVLTVGR